MGVIFVVSKIMKTLKSEGAVALEAHIENPESSAIFAEHPPFTG
jgi:chemotaxis protein MotA